MTITWMITVYTGAKNMFCYYTNWARYRKYPGNFTVDNIDPFLCTHIIYAFADISSGEIKYGDENDPGKYYFEIII